MLIRERLLKVLALFAIIYAGLAGIVFYHQVIQGPEIAARAAAIRSRSVPLEDISRGDILDRNGLFLTGIYTVPAAYCLPRLVHHPGQTASTLARVLGLEKSQVEEKIIQAKKQGSFFVLIKAPLSQGELVKLNNSSLPGIFYAPLKQRYPVDGFCSHLLGQVALVNRNSHENLRGNSRSHLYQDWAGVSGIEKRYDAVLSKGGAHQDLVAILDGRGKIIPGLFYRVLNRHQVRERANVVLSIDRRVQDAVEKAMNRGVKKGAVVVMDIHTREILAMASRPVFSNYRVAQALAGKEDSPLINRALAVYHPGSVFKLVVAAAALEDRLVSLGDTFTCNGKYVFNDRVSIACWKGDGHGQVNISQALAFSCNSAFIQVGERVGRERLLRYVQRMHVADNTIIGYPGVEEKGYVHIEPGAPAMGNASIGQQGVVLSPLQITSLIATIADNGQWCPPRMVEGIRSGDGEWERVFKPVPKQQVISPSTARQLQSMLRLAVQEGTGKKARLAEVATAGKTASSQTGRFHPDGREVLNTWFAGYLPADNPRWAIVVLVEDGVSGGESAAPVFKEIGQSLLRIFYPG